MQFALHHDLFCCPPLLPISFMDDFDGIAWGSNPEEHWKMNHTNPPKTGRVPNSQNVSNVLTKIPYTYIMHIVCSVWVHHSAACLAKCPSPYRSWIRHVQLYRNHSVYAPSQWDTALHCNAVSHWLGAYTKSLVVPWIKHGKLYRCFSCVDTLANGNTVWCRRYLSVAFAKIEGSDT